MSDDLPIKITLNPQPAVAGARAVTAAVATTEQGAKSATTSFAQLEKQLRNIEQEAAKAAKAAMGIDFKQGVGAANQLFELLNQKLKLTDGALGSVIGSATKFGALGAQVGGPWGAALGATLGIATDLSTQIDKLNQQALQSKLDALNTLQFIAEMKDIKGLLDGTNGAARDVHDRIAALYSDEGRAKKFFEPWQQGRKDMVEAAQAAEAAKNVMVDLRDISDRMSRGEHVSPADQVRLRDSGFTMAQYQKAIEDYTKAELALQMNRKSYGSVVTPILQAEEERAATLGKLKYALESETLTQRQRNAVQAEYNRLAKQGIDLAAAAHAAEMQRLRLAASLRVDGISDAQFSAVRSDLGDVDRAIREEAGLRVFGASTAGAFRPSPDLAIDLDAATRIHAAQQEAARFRETIDDLGKNSLAALEQAAQSLGDSLVDAFVDGRLELDKLLDSLGRMVLKASVNNLISFGFSQLPALATGGYLPPGGSGGTDSQVVAFRKSPWESVHVNTPPQEAAMRSGGGGGGVSGTQVVQMSADPRALLPLFDSREGERVIIAWAQKRGLL